MLVFSENKDVVTNFIKYMTRLIKCVMTQNHLILSKVKSMKMLPVVYTVVLPKKEFDVEVFVQIRFILLYNHNIN